MAETTTPAPCDACDGAHGTLTDEQLRTNAVQEHPLAEEWVSFDEDAEISRADCGAWVQAWVWVQYPEKGA